MSSQRLTAVEKTRLALLASVVVTFLLYLIPGGQWIIYPLLLLSTLVHELGHGVTAILVGGHFDRFEMWPDGSGVAYWAGADNRLELALVAAGGLVGPAIGAALGFLLGRNAKQARWALYALSLGLFLALLLVVRNFFGAAFVVFLLVLLLWVARSASEEMAQLILLFLSVQLALSVYSRSDYLFTPTAQTAEGAMPSDVGVIEQALWLPYWFWGGVCGLFSLAVVVYGLWVFWQPPVRRRSMRIS